MNAIVAANKDWGIGLGGTQALVIPEDRNRFKMLTDGGVVIIGRKTFEGFPEPLPNRKNIVLTRDKSFSADGVTIVRSIDEALAETADYAPDKVFVIGGGDIYKLFLSLCAFVYVTRIYISPQSDVFFPDLDTLPGWSLTHRKFGLWNQKSGTDLNNSQGSPHSFAPFYDDGSSVRYTFDLYKRQKRAGSQFTINSL